MRSEEGSVYSEQLHAKDCERRFRFSNTKNKRLAARLNMNENVTIVSKFVLEDQQKMGIFCQTIINIYL